MLRILALGHAVSLVTAACYDGGGGFTLANWPQCQDATPTISVYSGLSADGQYLKLGLHAANHSKGWSAVGFSGNGGMKGASQIVVRISETTGDWIAEDRYSLDYVTPTLDEQQDVKLIFASDNGVNTSWGVLIPKDSCDVDDYSIESVSRTLLWALGGSHSFGQHTSRGQFHANVVNGTVPYPALTGIEEVSFRMNSSVVSASSDATNPYICRIFDLRQVMPERNFSGKVHAAKFEPFLDPVSSGFVHHMILYGCSSNNGFTHDSIISDCESMPTGCNIFKWVWAVGLRDVQLPDEVGMPLGEGLFFVALQMHYYNPDQVSVRDTSGVKISVLNNLRPIDAGMFQLNGGTSPNTRTAPLPANMPTFTLEPPLIVPPICTNQWTSPITVLAAIHHMHLRGVNEIIEVVRNGTHLGAMRHERRYDFNHQSLEEPLIKTLYPGDTIKVTCQYNTVGKNVTTKFGENTQDEMCWAALMYYPAQVFRTSATQPSPSSAVLELAVHCTLPSTQFNETNLSACADKYWENPLQFINSSTSHSALFLCNNISTDVELFNTTTRGVQLCPSCSLDQSCDETALLTHAQEVVCPMYCNANYLSVYPNETQTELPEIRTYCDGPHGIRRFTFRNTFPSPNQCVVSGELDNETIVAAITAPILATQHGCPNSAIEQLLTRCSPSDFVRGEDNKNICSASCRNATAILAARVAATTPVLTGAQLMKCVENYNNTWGPDSAAGSAWPLWANLETRVTAGSELCDAPGGGGSVSAAFTTTTTPLAMVFTLACVFLSQ